MVTKILAVLASSPAACSISIISGVLVMLSVAYVDPSRSRDIAILHTAGGVLLLAPGFAQRFREM